VAAAPIVVGSMALLLSAVGYESATAGGHGTVDGVAGMISMDTPTYVRLLMVTGGGTDKWLFCLDFLHVYLVVMRSCLLH
jgi:hypothetical protein